MEFVIFLIAIIACIIFGMFSSRKKKTVNKATTRSPQQRDNNEEKTHQEAEDKRKTALLEQYKAMRLDTLPVQEQEAALDLLAKNFGLSDATEVRSAVQQIEKEQIAKQKQEEIEAKKVKIQIKNKYLSSLDWQPSPYVGKDKYLKKIQENIEGLVKQIEKLSGQSLNYKPVHFTAAKSDSYIAGGLSAGLGGPVAGALAYGESERRNAENQASMDSLNSALNRFNASMVTKNSYEIKKLTGMIKKYEDMTDRVNKWLVDTDHPQEWLEKADFSVIDKEVVCVNPLNWNWTDKYYGYKFALLHLRFKNWLPLFNQHAALVGRVKVSLWDCDKEIAQGQAFGDFMLYTTGPVFQWCNLRSHSGTVSEIDYGHNNKMSPDEDYTECTARVYCLEDDDINESKLNDYTVKIEPVELWAVIDPEYEAAIQRRLEN